MSIEVNVTAAELFVLNYNKVKKEIPFNPAWSNNMGAFDKAVYGEHAPILGSGQMARSITPGGRRMIFIGTKLGLVLIYDRFDPSELARRKIEPVFHVDTTKAVEMGGWFSRRRLDDFEMAIALGTGEIDEGNIGWRIDQLQSALKKAA